MTSTTVPFEFDIKKFQEEDLPEPVHVTGEAIRYATKEDAAAVWPNDATILEWLNDDVLARAKSNARAKALASHMEAYQASDAYKTKQAVTALMGLGYSKTDAEALAQKQK